MLYSCYYRFSPFLTCIECLGNILDVLRFWYKYSHSYSRSDDHCIWKMALCSGKLLSLIEILFYIFFSLLFFIFLFSSSPLLIYPPPLRWLVSVNHWTSLKADKNDSKLVLIGGNQREQARLKNLKKKEKENKGKSNLNGMTVTQKKE